MRLSHGISALFCGGEHFEEGFSVDWKFAHVPSFSNQKNDYVVHRALGTCVCLALESETIATWREFILLKGQSTSDT